MAVSDVFVAAVLCRGVLHVLEDLFRRCIVVRPCRVGRKTEGVIVRWNITLTAWITGEACQPLA
jgi:hypothetical protein